MNLTSLRLSWLNLADVLLTLAVILTALYTYVNTDMFTYLSANLPYVPGGLYLLLLVTVLAAFLLGLVVGTSSGNVICLGWALYLPSVLYFSRIDLLSLLIPGGYDLFSSRLPAPLILVAGVTLIGCTLAQGSVAELKQLRVSYTARGADREEVERAVTKNLAPTAAVLLAALLLSALVAAAATLLGPLLQHALAGGYWHLIFLVAGTALLVLLIVAFLWSRRA